MWDSLGRQVPEADFGRGDSDAAGVDGVAIDGGAPIYNGEVTLVDHAGHTRTTVTGPDGYYRIDIKGLTPPFVVSVHRPGGRHWFSASTAPVRVRGFVTIHLSGLSDKALSLVADAGGQGGFAAAVTPALLAANGDALAAAKAAIRASLGVALINAGLDPASYDPVTSPLQATAADKHALFLKGLTIRKNDQGTQADHRDGDAGRRGRARPPGRSRHGRQVLRAEIGCGRQRRQRLCRGQLRLPGR